MSSGAKIVVLGTHSAPTYAVFNFLKSRFPNSELFLEEPEGRLLFLRRRARKLGLFRVAGQVMFQLLVTPVLKMRAAKRIAQIQMDYGLSTHACSAASRVTSANSAECIQELLNFAPDLIVVAGTRILSRRFLESMLCPVVNVHAGITPLYRGVHGAYWALAEGRPDLCGVTVHLVDAGIDTGAVLEQAVIKPTTADNFCTYPWIQLGVGLRKLADLIPALLNRGHVCREPLASEARLRTHPTIWEYVHYRIARRLR